LRWAQWGATIELSRFNRKCPGHRAGLFVLTHDSSGENMAIRSKKPHKTLIFTVYLYRRCGRALQEGFLRMNDYKGKMDSHFNHLDEIPRKMRHQLKSVGLTYDVADDSDETVITEKKRKRRVIAKKRLGD
jgi:hypothetical protein